MSAYAEELKSLDEAIAKLEAIGGPEVQKALDYVRRQRVHIEWQMFSVVDLIDEAIDEVSRQRHLLAKGEQNG